MKFRVASEPVSLHSSTLIVRNSQQPEIRAHLDLMTRVTPVPSPPHRNPLFPPGQERLNYPREDTAANNRAVVYKVMFPGTDH
jgi:hypothetical protein